MGGGTGTSQLRLAADDGFGGSGDPAAGVGGYGVAPGVNVTKLIRDRCGVVSLSREDALDDLKKLRSETPKMTSEEIVDLVTEARADLS